MKNRIPENLCEALKVIYLPQLGCLVAVHGLMNEAAVPDDWEKQVSAANQPD
jgi:hypothetical protein